MIVGTLSHISSTQALVRALRREATANPAIFCGPSIRPSCREAVGFSFEGRLVTCHVEESFPGNIARTGRASCSPSMIIIFCRTEVAIRLSSWYPYATRNQQSRPYAARYEYSTWWEKYRRIYSWYEFRGRYPTRFWQRRSMF